MNGFPLNLEYSTLEEIVQEVYATGIHRRQGARGLEFALCVYCHAYPNKVISVWIYLATLFRRRR